MYLYIVFISIYIICIDIVLYINSYTLAAIDFSFYKYYMYTKLHMYENTVKLCLCIHICREINVSIMKHNPSKLCTNMEVRKEESRVSILDIHFNVI